MTHHTRFLPASATLAIAAALALLLATATAPSPAVAAGKHAGGHGDGANIGRPGEAANADRTISVTMKDSYYEPSEVTVKRGETVRFKVRNAGQLVHEFGLGTAKMHVMHQKEMMKMMEKGFLAASEIDHEAMQQSGMAHDDPNSILLEPGKEATLTWTFDTSMTLEFACNVPGHYEAGMVGRLHIRGDDGS